MDCCGLLWTDVDCGLWTVDCGLIWSVDLCGLLWTIVDCCHCCGLLWTFVGCGLWTDVVWTVD